MAHMILGAGVAVILGCRYFLTNNLKSAESAVHGCRSQAEGLARFQSTGRKILGHWAGVEEKELTKRRRSGGGPWFDVPRQEREQSNDAHHGDPPRSLRRAL